MLIQKEIDCYTLDKILGCYNWDDGFDLPLEIINHPNCELATALKAFYLAEGEEYLQNKTMDGAKEWLSFLKYLYERITSGCYSEKFVGFEVPLTRVQKYKLLKNAPDTPEIFSKDIAGSKNAKGCEEYTFAADAESI